MFSVVSHGTGGDQEGTEAEGVQEEASNGEEEAGGEQELEHVEDPEVEEVQG